MTSRHERGRRTESVLASWLRDRGWPYAEPTGAARSGVDITGTPGLAIEVKARRDFSPLGWVRQARTRPGLPLVVLRCDGQGEATVGEWLVLLRLEDAVPLLRCAGYGEGPT